MKLIKQYLSSYQQYYWKDPEHCRQLQKNKYHRYPNRIKEINKNWADKHIDYLKKLKQFNSRIFYWKNHNDQIKVDLLMKAKEEFKKQYKNN